MGGEWEIIGSDWEGSWMGWTWEGHEAGLGKGTAWDGIASGRRNCDGLEKKTWENGVEVGNDDYT